MTRDLMALSDLHLPAQNRKAVEWAARQRDRFKIETVIQVGDIGDQRIWSRFAQDPDFDNPDREWDLFIQEMHWLHRLFPQLTVIFGNHDCRIIKRSLDAGLPSQLIRGLNEIFPFPGWKYHMRPGPLIIDDVAIIHGDEMVGHVALKAQKLGMKLITGHSHQMRLEYVTIMNKTIWGMECGCLIDIHSSAFRYAVKNPRGQSLGIGMILDDVPILLPYRGE